MNISKLRKCVKNITIRAYAKEIENVLDMVDKTKTILNLSDSDIEQLIEKGYTFSEILAGGFNDSGVFEPEELIMDQTKVYLVENNKFNTYAQH